MRRLLVGLIACAIASAAYAQQPAYRFEDYPVHETYTGPSHAPVLATKDERMYRTNLREAARGKPNFAGHYIVTTWGCGSGCVMGGVIDAKTGRVTMIPFTLCCWPVDVPDDFEPVVYHLDSNLVVFDGARNEKESDTGKHYYVLANGQFKELTSVK
jgi:hypothetical protein